jgi:DNA-binding phage protein
MKSPNEIYKVIERHGGLTAIEQKTGLTRTEILRIIRDANNHDDKTKIAHAIGLSVKELFG